MGQVARGESVLSSEQRHLKQHQAGSRRRWQQNSAQELKPGVPKLLEMREDNSALWAVPGMEPNVSSPCKMLSVPMKMAASMLQPHRDLTPSHAGQWLLLCDGDTSWENKREMKTVISLCKGSFTESFSEDQK